jgi:hypothetical protein
VIRPARRHERGPDWSDAILGAVPAGTEARWPIDDEAAASAAAGARWPIDGEAAASAAAGARRPIDGEARPASTCAHLLVAIGQPGGRLRIHDHRAVLAPPWPGTRAAGPFPTPGPFRSPS